jgi:hypothetical protein
MKNLNATTETFQCNMARLCCGPDECNRNTVSCLGCKAYFWQKNHIALTPNDSILPAISLIFILPLLQDGGGQWLTALVEQAYINLKKI